MSTERLQSFKNIMRTMSYTCSLYIVQKKHASHTLRNILSCGCFSILRTTGHLDLRKLPFSAKILSELPNIVFGNNFWLQKKMNTDPSPSPPTKK